MSIDSLPAIVIMAYNRPFSLQRLLKSLIKAIYNENLVTLVISIDGAKEKENQSCIDLANNFSWNFGEKKIIVHERNLGIVNHVYFCLDLTEKFESIILIEDDHYISPVFYKYSTSVLKFYAKERTIFGFSLFSHIKNGFVNYPFYPIHENNDIFFLQLGFLQGLVITRGEWLLFKAWLSNSNNSKITTEDPFHPYLLQLEKKGTEWFQTLTKYLYTSNKYVGFPRISLSVNFHDTGTHNKQQSSWYQVPLLYEKSSFVFKSFESTNAVYDTYMEILPERLKKMNTNLASYDFEVDLLALKPKKLFKSSFILSTRETSYSEKSYALLMKPMEQNVIEKIEGSGINLAKKENFNFSKLKNAKIRRRNYYFYNPGRKKAIMLTSAILGLLTKLKII